MSDYETAQRKRNLIVGTFVFVALCALVWLIFKFGDLPEMVSGWRSFKLKVQFLSAPGVQRSTPVRFCGYQIGTVSEVLPPEIRKDIKTGLEYHQTIVVLNIDKKYHDIPGDVDVKLMTRGLGSSYIEFKPQPLDPNKPPAGVLTADSLLQGSTGVSSEFFPEESQKKLEKLVESFTALMNNANEIVGDETNKENLKSTMANLSETSKEATAAIKEFKEFFVAAVSTSEELSKTVTELRVILEKINSGQGSVAKLINDGHLYENLLENTQQLEMLLEEMTLFISRASDKGVPIKLK